VRGAGFPPSRSHDDIRAAAESVLKRHFGSVAIPVDIELLVEYHFNLNIVPIPHLKRRLGIDGFAMRDQIAVDYSSWEHNTNRYRFTLAHELGHHVLHPDLLNATTYSSTNEPGRWLSVSSAARRRYEWQAHHFAGNILLPPGPLAEEVRTGTSALVADGGELDLFILDDCERLARWIARRARVSQDVVMRRATEDGHWIPFRD
jgi:hypothetical protein